VILVDADDHVLGWASKLAGACRGRGGAGRAERGR
jgi:hypothetical protein